MGQNASISSMNKNTVLMDNARLIPINRIQAKWLPKAKDN
ncbi:hypothetical protein HCU01_41660 [Halomonas cupida]|uniref:Uncharacterized protein n=1 Tax=Halomonas cupida TaxID=44933 RepID=A0ABQ0WKX9_9GAMM|nr:hypothetical protein HCU01_41660 [Halomonas cupida]